MGRGTRKYGVGEIGLRDIISDKHESSYNPFLSNKENKIFNSYKIDKELKELAEFNYNQSPSEDNLRDLCKSAYRFHISKRNFYKKVPRDKVIKLEGEALDKDVLDGKNIKLLSNDFDFASLANLDSLDYNEAIKDFSFLDRRKADLEREKVEVKQLETELNNSLLPDQSLEKRINLRKKRIEIMKKIISRWDRCSNADILRKEIEELNS